MPLPARIMLFGAHSQTAMGTSLLYAEITRVGRHRRACVSGRVHTVNAPSSTTIHLIARSLLRRPVADRAVHLFCAAIMQKLPSFSAG
ncbi:hypothetical protein [Gluconacetobacter asukensis]|uniref:Uncharacterized protein n=1 Tax=Gluconacetobacter asukensis TaxID=1017181 RepID=A0A7W4IYF2_9PROT|nr:hypothetical protein [Gluconacetobacter asukensis]MBB2171363.1 hypothetical protein [Gluconacetobacter asukensis]